MNASGPDASPEPATVRHLYDSVGESLGFELLAGSEGLDSRILSPRIQKLGLAFAGYKEYLHPGRVQVIGRTEVNYLRILEPEQAHRAMEEIFSVGLCAIVVTAALKPPAELLEQANAAKVPVLGTSAPSSRAISEVTAYLSERLAPATTIHGVLMGVFGVGVLLVGESGIGKSECALDLILRGHRLVSDDMVKIRRLERQGLIGSGPEPFGFLMEVRGLGIINVKDLFGVSGVCLDHRLDLVIRLQRWKAEADYDRLGLEDEEEEILGVLVPRITLPVAPGRNLSTLVEVAVRLQLLKQRGQHPSRQFVRDLEGMLRVEGKRNLSGTENRELGG